MHTLAVTVTYRRHARVPDSSGRGGSGGASGAPERSPISRRCGRCNTEVVTTVRQSALVVDVRGRTCGECNPSAEPDGPAGGSSAGSGRSVKVSWAAGNDGAPRWRALVVDRECGIAAYRPDGVPDGVSDLAEARAVDSGWQRILATKLSDRLGAEGWDVVTDAWQPGHCGTLTALAMVLDDVWTHVVAAAVTGTRVQIRLVGLPPVVAALLPVVVTRPLLADGRPVLPAAELVRALGPAVCVGAGQAVACGIAHAEFGELSAPPTVGSLAGSSAFKLLRALDGHGAEQTAIRLPGPRFSRTEVPASASAARTFASGLVGNLERLENLVDAPDTASRFGRR